jgi:transposase-like protein
MPWKETTVMEQKIEYITEWRSGQFAITELCRAFGISRTTAYKYINRFQEKGIEGLYELNRAPHVRPNKTPETIEQRIVAYRKQYPRWGGEKIWKQLHQDFRQSAILKRSMECRLQG